MTMIHFNVSLFTVTLINGPLLILNLMANIFFVFCLITCKTQQVKKPLTILLGSVVSYTILYVLSVTLTYILAWVELLVVVNIIDAIVAFLMRGNKTTYVWLMFYYYIMIVPSQRVLFLWVKKNIKSVIYVLILLDGVIFLCDAYFDVTSNMDYSRCNNGTGFVYAIKINFVFTSIVKIYVLLCLFIMIFSCFATARYLNKHMKRLAASDGSLSNPRLHSQIRVTITGIIQGVVCFLCAIWNLLYVMSNCLSPYFNFDPYINKMVNNLYISGTTVNLGVGQTLFRERAVHVWKAVKKRLCTGKSLKDLRPPGNLVTIT